MGVLGEFWGSSGGIILNSGCASGQANGRCLVLKYQKSDNSRPGTPTRLPRKSFCLNVALNWCRDSASSLHDLEHGNAADVFQREIDFMRLWIDSDHMGIVAQETFPAFLHAVR